VSSQPPVNPFSSLGPDAVALDRVLDSEEIATDVYRAWTPPNSGRKDIFGGQVAGQALRAAVQTVDQAHLPNSLHGYFLRRGRPDLPLDIHVERVRAGRSYTSRRIDVRQDDKTIFAMLASFHSDEPGPEFDHEMPEGIPGPDELEDASDRFWHPGIQMRDVEGETGLVQWWARVVEPFPGDPAFHYCALLYASDIRAGGAVISAIGYGRGDSPPSDSEGNTLGNFGSLDHSVWFHRTPDVRDWFYCDVRSLTVRDSRGLVLGRMFDQGGRHLATFTQEVFMKIGEDPVWRDQSAG
jgi:acyl-CoA thioesterase II